MRHFEFFQTIFICIILYLYCLNANFKFSKTRQIEQFWAFLINFSKRSSLRSQCWMRLFLWFLIGLEKAFVLLIPISGREKAFTQQCYHQSRTDALYWVLIAIVPIVRNGPIWPYRRRLALLIDDQDLLTAVILLCEPI